MTYDTTRFITFCILVGWAGVSVGWLIHAVIEWAAGLVRSIRQGGR